TMGRRLRVLWRLRTGAGAGTDGDGAATAPRVLVAPVRALVQRLGPHVEEIEPVIVRPGDHLDQDDLMARLVATGYRREYQVEARESWLPWLPAGAHVVADLVGPDAQILLVEPRRMRDRAADLLAEEADLAAALAQTWGARHDGDRDWPRLHLPFDRLLAHTR